LTPSYTGLPLTTMRNCGRSHDVLTDAGIPILSGEHPPKSCQNRQRDWFPCKGRNGVTSWEDYRWSSYGALACGRGGPAWFDARLVYEQLDLDAKGFRQAVRRYDERADDLFSSLHYGLVLGSEAVVEELRRRVLGVREPDKPQLRALQSHGTIQEHLEEYRRRLRIDSQEYASLLRPIRRRERPMREVLMYLLWRQGRFRMGQIAEQFGIGDSAVSHACRRAEQRLQTERKLQSQLKDLLR
jgi:hypothetical protein